MNTPEAQADVGYGGIKAFSLCENVMEDIESLISTLKMFIQPKSRYHNPVPAYVEKATLAFLKGAMGLELVERETHKVTIDKDIVQSGDFFGRMRWDGLGAIIQYEAGGHINHCVMALRFDGELYIVESTDGGLQRTLWDEWMAKCESTGDSLTWHRLSAEARANFDEKKA